jgi:hypothetical protein
MGYVYTHSGQLCCDACGHAGARRIKCPHGYCQPFASCDICLPQTRALDHSSCLAASQKMAADQAFTDALMAVGEYVRTSAVRDDEGNVRVGFRGANGARAVFGMSQGTYRAIPLLEPATPASYRAYGEVWPLPGKDI